MNLCKSLSSIFITAIGLLSLPAGLALRPATAQVETPQLIWKTQNNLCIFGKPAVSDDGKIYASATTTFDPAIGCEGRNAGLVEIDIQTGRMLFGPVIPPGCTSFGTKGFSISESGDIFGVGDWNDCRNGRLVSFDKLGTIRWDHGDCPGGGNTSPHPRQIPALDEELGSVYFGSSSFCSVDMISGNNNWTSSGGRSIGVGRIAIDADHNIYHATFPSGIGVGRFRGHTSAGVELWNADIGGNFSRIVAVTSNNQKVIGIINNNDDATEIRLVDETGQQIWSAFGSHQRDGPAGNFGQRAVTDNQGVLYVTGLSVCPERS